MTRGEQPAPFRREPVAPDAGCPSWCRGCGPYDPLHRGILATVGRAGGGWVSVELLLGRFDRGEATARLDATRFGATQVVLLTGAQLERLIGELSRARELMRRPTLPSAGRARQL